MRNYHNLSDLSKLIQKKLKLNLGNFKNLGPLRHP